MRKTRTQIGIETGKLICTKCKSIKQVKQFNLEKYSGRYGSHCKSCRARHNKANRAAKRHAMIAQGIGQSFTQRNQTRLQIANTTGKINCIACGETRSKNQFYFDKYWNQYDSRCKACRNKQTVDLRYAREGRERKRGKPRMQIALETGSIICTSCNVVKPMEDFYICPNRGVLKSHCRACSSRRANKGMINARKETNAGTAC